MELVERMVAVEKEIEILNRETLRLRDAEIRVFKAIEETNQQVGRISGIVENVQGTVHLIAENAAALAINRYKAEAEASGAKGLAGSMLKLVGVLIAIIATLVGVSQTPLL